MRRLRPPFWMVEFFFCAKISCQKKGSLWIDIEGFFPIFLAFWGSFPTFWLVNNIFSIASKNYIIRYIQLLICKNISIHIFAYNTLLFRSIRNSKSVSTFCQVCLPMCSEDGTDVPGGQGKKISKKDRDISDDSWPDLCWFTCVLFQKLWLCICIYIYINALYIHMSMEYQ